MWIYICCFVLSCFLLKIGGKQKGKKQRLFYLAGIMLPCILAGFRYYTVGTDVKIYVKPMVDIALTSKGFKNFLYTNWWYLWDYKSASQFEFGYVIYIYLIAKIFRNLQFVLFFIQFLIILPVFCGLKKFKELDGKEWLAMLIFYAMFYNVSLNAMRQYMSLGILFYGLSCTINEKKDFKFFVSLIFAFMFHKSSLLGLLIYIIYKVFNDESSNKYYLTLGMKKIKLSYFLTLFLSVISLILIYNSSLLTFMLKLIGFERYNGYISGNVSFSVNSILKILPIIYIYILNRKDYLKTKDAYFYLFIYIFSIFLNQFATVSEYGGRIAYAFEIFNIVFFCKLCLCINKKNYFTHFILVLYLCFYWWFYFGYGGSSETVPFIFYFK